MRKFTLLFLLLSFTTWSYSRSVNSAVSYYQLPEGVTTEDYLIGTIVIKEKEDYRGILSGTSYENADFLNQVLNYIGNTESNKTYPHHEKPKREKNAMGLEYVDLSLIYQIDYSSDKSIEECINLLLATNLFEYVEPLFLHKELYDPNDPEYGNQWYLSNIMAPQAWDINNGDTTIVIAITDTGIEKLHDDIVNKIKYNYDDPINGSDDDGDGYVDNFYGWDVGDDDNDPEINGQHGLWVAGIAGMEPDNSSHGAGVGFKTKLLPIKVKDSGGSLAQAYPGIVYAADHGAHVINCSWGSANSWSQYGEDIIAYATINQDALVVGAAGNSNADEAYYPASFKYAISVATTKPGDIKDNWATYNSNVDLSAPGASMKTTMQSNGWGDVGAGSSFAAPVVSGAAAIVKAHYPSYNAIQIGERLKTTSDVIDTIAANSAWVGKIGSGRVNLYNALTMTGVPSINMDSQTYSSNTFTDGESVTLSGDFINYLDPSSSGLTATLSSTSPYISVTQPTSTLGVINTLATVDNIAQAFGFDILPGAAANTVADLTVTYNDGGYTASQTISIVINRDYADLDVNDILVTVTSKGRFGYNQNNQTNGSGMIYQGGSPMFWEMNFMVAKSTTQVSFDRDDEFAKVSDLEIIDPGMEGNKDYKSVYNDDPAGASKLDVEVKQKTLAWNDSGHENYFIVEYNIINRGATDLIDVYPALYADWDIDVWNQNEATYDADRKMGVVYKPGGTYAGVRLLTDTSSFNYYAFNNDGAGGSYSIYDGFSQTEQFNSVSNGILRSDASLGDVAHIVGSGGHTIAVGDSLLVAFAVMAGSDLASIEAGADSAAVQYYNIRHVEMALNSISNASCNADCNGWATVSTTFGVEPYTYEWNDPSSQTGATATGLCAGTYLVTVTDYVGNTANTNVIITEPEVLDAILDTSYNTSCNASCDGGVGVSVTGGTIGYSYQWSDVSIPGIPDPMLCAGSYTLVVTDAQGCEDSISTVITEPDPIVLSFVDTLSVFDPDSCNGSAEVSATGGTGALSYLWDDNDTQTTALATDLCQGDYTVIVTDENGCEESVSVTIDFIEGLEETLQDLNIKLYPNPSSGIVNVSHEFTNEVSYEIYNMLGTKVDQGLLINDMSLDLSNLPNGVYVFMINNQDEIYSIRFEIVK